MFFYSPNWDLRFGSGDTDFQVRITPLPLSVMFVEESRASRILCFSGRKKRFSCGEGRSGRTRPDGTTTVLASINRGTDPCSKPTSKSKIKFKELGLADLTSGGKNDHGEARLSLDEDLASFLSVFAQESA